MSIKITQDITRENAIDRIIKINLLAKDRNFYELEKITNEKDTTFSEFIQDNDWYNSFYDYSDINILYTFTNTMLSDIMDSLFIVFQCLIIMK